MATQVINGQEFLGTDLQQLLLCDAIQPGSKPSYETCKVIYAHHPHGAKLVDFPVQMAMYKPRKITVPKAPDDGKMLVDAFLAEWKAMGADRNILNTARQARMYGVTTMGVLTKGQAPSAELDFKGLAKAEIAFNVWDPLNSAGSLVLNQDPLALDFQKVAGVVVNGTQVHRSRCVVLQNESPLYIEYQSSGFGFLGRSVYQRGLVPLKSFVLTLATDMMIALKAGVLVAKMESQSSAVDAPMVWLFGGKRQLVKEAQVGNVLSIGVTEDIESLNLQNLDAPYTVARKNIIENEASACGTPSKIVLAETYAEGFAEGTEDAKAVAMFVETIREWILPLYDFLDPICMYRAWNEDFYETVQARYPEEYGDVSYTVAFQDWKNSFTTEFPSLLEEPESERLKGEDVVLKAIIAVVEVLLPAVPPTVKAKVIEFMQDNINEKKRLFAAPMDLDFDEIANYEPAVPEKEPDAAPPESQRDSAPRRERLDGVDEEVRRIAREGLRLVQGHAAAAGGSV